MEFIPSNHPLEKINPLSETPLKGNQTPHRVSSTTTPSEQIPPSPAATAITSVTGTQAATAASQMTDPTKIQKAFNQTHAQIEKIQKEIDQAEEAYLLNVIEAYEWGSTPSLKLTHNYEANQQRLNGLLNQQAAKLSSLYNRLIELKAKQDPKTKNPALDQAIKSCKQELNALKTRFATQGLGTHSRSLAKAKLFQIQAIYEKRLALKKREKDLTNEINKSWFALFERWERWGIQNELDAMGSEAIDQKMQSMNTLLSSVNDDFAKLQNEFQAQPLNLNGASKGTNAVPNQIQKIETLSDENIKTALETLDAIIQSPSARQLESKVYNKLNTQINGLRKKLHELKKVHKKLNALPSTQTLRQMKKEAEDAFKNPKIKTHAQAKAEYKKLEKTLPLTGKELNLALAHPSQSTTIHRLALFESAKSGKVYFGATQMTPIRTPKTVSQTAGFIPAGLKEDKQYNQNPTNFFRQEHVLLGFEKETKTTVFRGAVFTSKEAAKKALVAIAQENPDEPIHINSLLTPVMIGKPDKDLLQAHQKYLLEAAQELKNESNDITFFLSNFGVNAGAIGELEIMDYRIEAGWHHSFENYNNEAAQRLNTLLKTKLANLKQATLIGSLTTEEQKLFDRLPQIVHIAKELQKIWDQNDYARARVGNNPFKMAALWQQLDHLLGISTYAHCMSGKDRDGRVQTDYLARQAESAIQTIEHQQELEAYITEKIDTWSQRTGAAVAPDAKQRVIKAFARPAFQKETIDRLFQLAPDNNIETIIDDADIWITFKTAEAIDNLGFDASKDAIEGELLSPKTGPGSFMDVGVDGIHQPKPIKQPVSSSEEALKLPNLTQSSTYSSRRLSNDRLEALTHLAKNPYHEENGIERHLHTRHIEAQNRRQAITATGSLEITARNTGHRPGFKVDGGRPLEINSSGFDRDYVIIQLLRGKPNLPVNEGKAFLQLFEDLTGMHELAIDPEIGNLYVEEFLVINNSFGQSPDLSPKEKAEAYDKLLIQLEKAKADILYPPAKVKA